MNPKNAFHFLTRFKMFRSMLDVVTKDAAKFGIDKMSKMKSGKKLLESTKRQCGKMVFYWGSSTAELFFHIIYFDNGKIFGILFCGQRTSARTIDNIVGFPWRLARLGSKWSFSPKGVRWFPIFNAHAEIQITYVWVRYIAKGQMLWDTFVLKIFT